MTLIMNRDEHYFALRPVVAVHLFCTCEVFVAIFVVTYDTPVDLKNCPHYSRSETPVPMNHVYQQPVPVSTCLR